jgi:endonuclease YncB( thermonuclease family)
MWTTSPRATLYNLLRLKQTSMLPSPTRRPLAFLALLLLLATPLLAAEYAGRVTAVHDVDTLTLLVPDGASYQQVRVRLGAIDTPESKQPYGTRARQALSDLVFGKQAPGWWCRTPTATGASWGGCTWAAWT